MLHGSENWPYKEGNEIRLGKYDAKISKYVVLEQRVVE